MSILLKSSELLMDPSNQTISHVIDRVGISSAITAGSINVAESTGMIEQGLALTDWALIIAIIGGLLYIVKLTLDIFISYMKIKKD